MYVADLERLLALSRHKVSGYADPVMLEQLIAALPPDYTWQLRLSTAGKALKISRCLEQIRMLMATAHNVSAIG